MYFNRPGLHNSPRISCSVEQTNFDTVPGMRQQPVPCRIYKISCERVARSKDAAALAEQEGGFPSSSSSFKANDDETTTTTNNQHTQARITFYKNSATNNSLTTPTFGDAGMEKICKARICVVGVGRIARRPHTCWSAPVSGTFVSLI
jgi:hypothetical protein